MIVELCFFAATLADPAHAARQDAPAPLGTPAQADAPAATEKPRVPIEEEVLGNVKAMPIGTVTVDDLALPDDFLKRVTDRVIRSSFEDRYRIILPDAPPDAAVKQPVAAPPASAPQTPATKTSLPLIVGTAVLAVFVVLGLVFARRGSGGAR